MRQLNTHTQTHTHTHTCMPACVHAHIHMCGHVYTNTHTPHTHLYTHTHTHTHRKEKTDKGGRGGAVITGIDHGRRTKTGYMTYLTESAFLGRATERPELEPSRLSPFTALQKRSLVGDWYHNENHHQLKLTVIMEISANSW